MPVSIGGSGPITGVTSINTTVTDTELGYLDGVTSALQTQINGKGDYVAWTSWTPTWTNLTVGNGSTNAYYTRIGKTVYLALDFAFGSTSSISSGNTTFTLPVTSDVNGYRGGATPIGQIHMRDIGVQSYTGLLIWNSSTTAILQRNAVSGSNVVLGEVSTSQPFTWATSDYFVITATYQAA